MLSKPPTRRPREYGARPTDDQLLLGARRIFAAVGYHRATMSDVAAHAGCTKPTLYAHFRDKEALYDAVLAREIRVLEGRLFAAYDGARALPLHDLIDASMRVFFDYAGEEPDGFRLLFGGQGGVSLSDARDQLVTDIRTRIANLAREYASSQGIKLGASAEILAAMMVAVAIDGAQQSILITPVDPITANALATTFVENALRNLDLGLLQQLDH